MPSRLGRARGTSRPVMAGKNVRIRLGGSRRSAIKTTRLESTSMALGERWWGGGSGEECGEVVVATAGLLCHKSGEGSFSLRSGHRHFRI